MIFRFSIFATVLLTALVAAAGPSGLPAHGNSLANVSPERLALVPKPLSVTRAPGAFTVNAHTRIIADPDPATRAIAGQLRAMLRPATGYPLPVTFARRRQVPANTIQLTHTQVASSLGPEGYALRIDPRHVVIRAPGDAGLFYGIQTLRQLLPVSLASGHRVSGTSWTIPAVLIWDKPAFSLRGLMVDSSRHLQSLHYLKRTIDRMASLKMNTFQWHLSDDNGWRLEIKRYPKLTAVGAWRTEADGSRYGGFYTQQEARDLVAYAAQRYVTVVPEIDMPGHSAAIIASYPELATTPGPFFVRRIGEGGNNVLDVAKPQTYVFINAVMTEVAAIFPSPVIHVGGDEVNPSYWREAPDCQALMQSNNLHSGRALQNYFENRVYAILQAHGRRMQGWNEVLNGGPLPQSVIIHQWNQPQIGAEAARAGHDVVVSTTTWAYFDYPYAGSPLSKVYQFDPMPDGLTPEEQKRILGPQAELWTEKFPTEESLDNYLWPRLIAMAEVGWTPFSHRDWSDFVGRLEGGYYQRLARMGLGSALTEAQAYDQLMKYTMPAPGILLGSWTPRQMSEQWTDLEWKVPALIISDGAYSVSLDYTAGADGIDIGAVSLLADGKVIDTDTHDAFAGGNSHDNLYTLTVSRYDPHAVYSIHVHLRSDGGTDSSGQAHGKKKAAP